jgi:KDO2-lipid IV(A) lauroyltransferase
MTRPAIPLAEDATCGVPLLPLSGFLAPRWWPVWVGYGFVWLLSLLPWSWRTLIARGLGALAYPLGGKARRVTLVNLRLAYPSRSAAERGRIARRHFQSLMYSLCEAGLVWFDHSDRLARLTRVAGQEHLDAALAAGRGVLLLGAHFTTNEIAAAALPATGHRFDVMYKPSNNQLLNQLILRARIRRGGRLIPSERFVEMLKVLKRGGIVLYAPDQRFDGAGSITVPLFGVPAMSNPGTTFVARATRCAVLPFIPRRLDDGSGYVMTICPELADFPSGDAVADVARYHALIEAAVHDAPEQYLWSYKRFRPAAGQPDPYRGP